MPAPAKLRFSDTTASVLLDAIRGIAATLVLLEHWRNAFFVDLPQVPSHRMLLSGVYLLCAAGHQAVIIFFVLSGYLISGSVLRAFQRNEWSWKQYLTHRLVRLWIVLLPALVLGACWDHLGLHSQWASTMYGGANYNHMVADVRQSLSWRDFLGNAAFVQTILVPTFGSNGALWSLANEFWYYILFPLAACIAWRIYRKPLSVAICGIAFCAVTIFLTRDILLAFPVWLLGVLLHFVPGRVTSRFLRIVAASAYAIVFFGAVVLEHRGWRAPQPLADLLLGLATFGFLWVLLGALSKAKPTIPSRLSRAAARFSFTLYVAHTPILIFLVALLAHDTRWIPAPKTGGIAFAALVVVVAYAWLLATATEFRTDRVRAWVEGKLVPAQNRRPQD
jgi:peptidoglycan/LPS O-acetylase OafA/YrhL